MAGLIREREKRCVRKGRESEKAKAGRGRGGSSSKVVCCVVGTRQDKGLFVKRRGEGGC